MDTSKIIKGVVSGRNFTTTAPIIKENYGIYLQIEGVELPETYQVDFSNEEHHGTSVTMIGNADGVRIPRQFIDTGKDIFAFLYWVGEDYGKTVHKFRIPNKLRPDRTEETPTPEEQSVIDQAINALNEAVAQTAQDVINADASAQSASADADRAEQAKEDASTFAQRSANSAQASADYSSSAQVSATASAQSASEAETARQATTSLAAEAQGYANASAQSATASANSAEQAHQYAQTASLEAESAQDYATRADISANTASAKASEASTSASTASAKATESAQSASQALSYKTDAESAKTASQTAQGLAESARDSAISAKNDAESARDDAQTLVDGISGKVEQIDSNTDRIESLEDDRYKPYVTDSASGSIASFPDGADDIPLKSLVVDINPVQDLHGQDAPYPAGGGKNKFKDTLDGWTRPVNYWIYPVTLADGTYKLSATLRSGKTAVTGCAVGFAKNGTQYTDFDPLVLAVNTSGATVAASPVTIESGDSPKLAFYGSEQQFAQVMDAYEIQLEVGNTATSYAPYENICPINGWEGCNVIASGKNLLDETKLNDAHLINCFIDDASHPQQRKGIAIYLPSGTYSFTCWKSVATAYLYYNVVKNDGTFVKFGFLATGTDYTTVKITLSDDEHILLFDQQASKESTQTKFANYHLQLELGTTATDYEPYKGRTIPISWQTEAGTVYGGSLDVLSGVMRVDRAILVLDGTTGKNMTGMWTARNNRDASVFYRLISNGLRVGAMCDKLAYTTGLGYTNVPPYYHALSSGASGTYSISLPYTVASSVAEANAWFADNPCTICYRLATPIEIQLTPHEVNSLLGVNNIWADTGDTEVKYRADTRLYIEKLTQPEEDDMIADSAITSGQFFMVGNSLYRALANIASGATITVGTNAQRVSLSDALNLVNT